MSYDWIIIPALLTGVLSVIHFHYCYRKFHNIWFTLVGILVLYQIATQVIFSAFYGFIEEYPWEHYYSISPVNLFLVYLMTFLGWIMWIVGFHGLGNLRNKIIKRIKLPKISHKNTNVFLVLLLSVSAILLVIQFASGLGQYGNITSYEASAEIGSSRTGIIDIPLKLLAPIQSIFYTSGIIAAAIIATKKSNRKTGKLIRSISWLFILSISLMGIVVGVRGITFGTFLIVTICGLLQDNKKMLWIPAGGIIIIALLSSTIGNEYRMLLQGYQAISMTPMQRVAALIELKKETSSDSNELTEFWHEIGQRYDDARLSAGLFKAVEQEGHAGLTPITSSLLSFIPRAIYVNKPVPGSYDGTHAGHPFFVVWRETAGIVFGVSGAFTPAAHAFWELNIPGVVFLGLFAGLFSRIVLEISKSAGAVGIILWMLSLKPNYFMIYLWTPEIIRLIYHQIIPLILLTWFISLFTRIQLLSSLRDAKFSKIQQH